jgi:hypothetical protein
MKFNEKLEQDFQDKLNPRYSIRVLEEKLDKEKKSLMLFTNAKPVGSYHDDWKKENIVACEHRIKELETTIEFLKQFLKRN